MSKGNRPYSSAVEHDARFQSSKGGVLIAVVSMFVLIFLCVRKIFLSLGKWK